MVRGLWSAVTGAVVLATVSASASERNGVYGRTDGDASVVVGVDAGMVGGRKLLGADLRVRYIESIGVALGYEELDALARAEAEGDLRRALRAGIELRPLFATRFLKDREAGNPFADMFLDSIALDVGAVWSVREGMNAHRPGMYAGIAAELPLSRHASGPWLRVATSFRWTAPYLEGDDDVKGRTFALTVGFAWHEIFDAHLVDRGDRRVR